MSVNAIDIKIQFPNTEPFSMPQIVGSGVVASINAGEPTKQGSAGAVAIMVDGDGSTSQQFTGISKSVSTDTASAAGIVYTYIPFPGLVYAARATTLGLANTAALINALHFKRVKFDVTAGLWTVDTADADSASANGLLIIGGEFQTSTIWFIVRTAVSIFNNLTT